jgi:predicted ribosomally synthesized peptide with SipW-like signal peptide
MKKKVLITLVVIALMSVLVTGSTIAWLTDKAQATNHVSIGNVDIEVEEPSWNSEDAVDIWPGKITAKDPRVKNTGKNPGYIRVKVVMDSALSEYVTFDFDSGLPTSQWFKEGDYYYFKSFLQPLASTSALFTQFTFSEDYIEPPVGTTPSFDIFVYAEAVQSQGFEPLDNSEAAFRTAILAAFEEFEDQEN